VARAAFADPRRSSFGHSRLRDLGSVPVFSSTWLQQALGRVPALAPCHGYAVAAAAPSLTRILQRFRQ
jgi:hypothetical protein